MKNNTHMYTHTTYDTFTKGYNICTYKNKAVYGSLKSRFTEFSCFACKDKKEVQEELTSCLFDSL